MQSGPGVAVAIGLCVRPLMADPEGQHCEITQQLRDVDSEAWGAQMPDALPGHERH